MRSGLGLAATVILATACGGGGGFPDAHVKDTTPPPAGSLKVAWSVTDDHGAPITCDQASAATVSITMRSTDIVGGIANGFSCGAGMGEAPDIPPGTYSVDVELDATNGTTIATAPRMMNIVIKSGEVTTAPQAVTFAVATTGNLAVNLVANQPGITSNCAGAGSQGAAITGMTLTMTAVADGACATDTVFTVGPSALTGEPGGRTYTVNCAAPAVTPCIEKDQAITATAIPSGSFLIHVRGLDGPQTCWQNDDRLVVPAANGTLTSTLNLGFQSGC